MVRFAKWHPLVQFCFLLCVLLLTCLSRHPVPVALSLLGAAVYLLLKAVSLAAALFARYLVRQSVWEPAGKNGEMVTE